MPTNRRLYKVDPQHLPELNRQIRVLLDAGIIRKTISQQYDGSPVLFAPTGTGKKGSKLRLCVDYHGRQQVDWTVACEESLGDLKQALTTAPVCCFVLLNQ